VPTDAEVRARVLDLPKDEDSDVRQQACAALAPLVPTDAEVRSSLDFVKADIWDILSKATHEVPALRQALLEGKVDGSTYTGSCACLVGTLANARGVGFASIPGVNPDADRPAERWFTGIRRGDRPTTNPISAAALYWVDEFLAAQNP